MLSVPIHYDIVSPRCRSSRPRDNAPVAQGIHSMTGNIWPPLFAAVVLRHVYQNLISCADPPPAA